MDVLIEGALFLVLFAIAAAVSGYAFLTVWTAQIKGDDWRWSQLVRTGVPIASGVIFLFAIVVRTRTPGSVLLVPGLAAAAIVVTAIVLTAISFVPDLWSGLIRSVRPAPADLTPHEGPHEVPHEEPSERLRVIGWGETGLRGRTAKMIDHMPVESNLAPVDTGPNDCRYVVILDDEANVFFDVRVRLLDEAHTYEFMIDSRALWLTTP